MNKTGILLALLSALLFGASTPFAKLLLGTVDPWMMAGLLYLGAGLGLAIFHLSRSLTGLAAVEAPLRRADLPWLALVVLAGGVLGPLLLMLGLARTDPAAASLLLNLEGLATMAIAWMAFRENVDRRLLLGAAAILAGAVLLSWHGQAALSLGRAADRRRLPLLGHRQQPDAQASSADPVQIAMIKGLVAGAVNLPLGLAAARVLPLARRAVGARGAGRAARLRRQSRAFRARAPPSRHGADRRLFLRSRPSSAPCSPSSAGRPAVGTVLLGRRRADGGRPVTLHLAERHDHEHRTRRWSTSTATFTTRTIGTPTGPTAAGRAA